MKKASPVFDIEKVSHYLNFFATQIANIDKSGILESHKEILYVCILDTLSKTVYPKMNENRKKFSLFIQMFSDWRHWSKISLPHLVRLLIKTPQPEFNILREFTYAEIGKWTEGEIVDLDKEPDYEQVKKLWPKEKDYEKPIEGVTIEHLRHDNLLYKYRNSIVHELRRPGYGMDIGKHEQPIYHIMRHKNDEVTWELVYPTKFFKTLCEQTLTQLSKYYEQNCIDPYSFYDFGTYWLKELN